MTVLGILFFISLSILSVGAGSIGELYRATNSAIVYKEKPPQQIIICIVACVILGIAGAVLYYHVCAATIEDIIKPRHPVESPIRYGIGMLLTSAVFTGGFVSVDFLREGEGGVFKTGMSITVVILVVYLLLKSQMVLP